nr:MFS transporter [Clavibacter sp. VKM Ac-2872]
MLRSVTLISGAGQVIEFVLPLYAADGLGLSAAWTGLLLGAALIAAFLVRPLAGVAVDRVDRHTIAAASAVILAAAYVLLATADSFVVALVSAVIGRAASTFLWIAFRAMAAGRSSTEPRASSRMLRAEDLGSWLVLAPAVGLVSLVGFEAALAAAAACALGGAVVLVRMRTVQRAPRAESLPIGELMLGDRRTALTRKLKRDLRPVLLAVLLIGAAEAAMSLLLLMHLQRHLGLSPLALAVTVLPSLLALTVAPQNVRTLTIRYGRRRMIWCALAAHVVCAVGLAVSREPTMIAALWALSAVGLSALLPIEQTIVAAVAGTRRVGRAFGLYETVALLGAGAGALFAGVLFDNWPWPAMCFACAGAMVGGGLVLVSCVPVTRMVPTRVEA